jgi:ATP-dependent helicase/nuclease subunit A
LPALEPGARAAAADRWLERSSRLTDTAARSAIVGEVCAILADARFSSLFGAGSLAEAPLAASLPDGRVIAGTVDRLLVNEKRILVIDFKTGRVPRDKGEIPNSHRAQIEAYADALRVIFPGREISAALVYTAGPKLIQVMG